MVASKIPKNNQISKAESNVMEDSNIKEFGVNFFFFDHQNM